MFVFPWTNLHELNLDWILQQVKRLVDSNDEFNDKADYAVETADEAKTIAEQAAQATIADGSVTTPKIADGAVTGNKIAQATIQTGNLSAGCVTNPKILDNAVTNPKIANSAITPSKIDSSAYYISRDVTAEEQEIAVNGRGVYSFDVTYTGYTLIGVIGVSLSNNYLLIGSFRVTGNSGQVVLHNKSSTAQSTSVTLKVLYRPNP